MDRNAKSARPATGSRATAAKRGSRGHEADRRRADLLAEQDATREILDVIHRSPGDAGPVLQRIAHAALALCRAESAVVATYDGELLRIGALASTTPAGADAIRNVFPRPASRDNAATRAVYERKTVMIPDVREDADYATGPDAVAAGFRSVLAVPLLDRGEPIGVISLGRATPGPFPEEHGRLLETFAAQAVIALLNTRRFVELGDRNTALAAALDQQTATSEILRVINQSPTDVQPVFDMIAGSVLKLCGAAQANVFTYDGSLIHVAASVNANPDYAAKIRAHFPRPPGRFTAVTRSVASGEVEVVADVLEDAEYAIPQLSAASGFRSVLAVPLLRNGVVIGALAVGKPLPGPFAAEQVALVQSFADQAVIAIENVRLFKELEARNRELSEALAHQTATADILSVISRSRTDIQPVFETIASNALRLCSGVFSGLFRYDGELIHIGALANVTPGIAAALRTAYPCAPHRGGTTQRAIVTREIVHMPDIGDDSEYRYQDVAAAAGFRSVVSVPMLRGDAPVGAITVYRDVAGPFPADQLKLLKTFADQAVIAIENVRLFNELEARSAALARSVDELRALGEVGQAVSGTLDLDLVLGTIVERATQLTGMDGGSIYEYDAVRDEFQLRAAERLPAELVDALRATPMRKGEGALGRMALTREPVAIHDLADEAAYQSRVREILLRLGYRSLLAVPLVRESQLLGGIAMNRRHAGPFAADTIALLQTFASQSALALQNARLYREVEQKRRELESASRHKSEFLANMSHELRTPLNAVIGFSEVLAERMFGELNPKQAEYIDDILVSGRHLLALINDILDLSKIEAGRMELDCTDVDVAAAVSAALTLVRERAQRRDIALRCDVGPGVGTARADERKVKQILLNLLSNALKFTPEGGSVGVRARVRDGRYEIAVSDTGIGIAPADQAAVFEEFRQVGASTKKVEGTGLGLAISRKYAELHGGTLTVSSELGKGATFTLTLPR